MNSRLLIFYALIVSIILGLTFFVHNHPVSSFDIHVTHEIQEFKTGDFTSLMKFISSFGNPIGLSLSIIFVSLFFFVTNNRRESCFIFTTLIPDLLNMLVKIMISRPRPTLENAQLLLNFNQSSFPSGHVVHYVVFFGFLLVVMLINKQIPSFWRMTIGILSAILILAISVSRIYLGAHWVSDVIGGYLFGFAYLGIILKFYFNKRRKEE